MGLPAGLLFTIMLCTDCLLCSAVTALLWIWPTSHAKHAGVPQHLKPIPAMALAWKRCACMS